jgi:hypothetical protein
MFISVTSPVLESSESLMYGRGYSRKCEPEQHSLNSYRMSRYHEDVKVWEIAPRIDVTPLLRGVLFYSANEEHSYQITFVKYSSGPLRVYRFFFNSLSGGWSPVGSTRRGGH